MLYANQRNDRVLFATAGTTLQVMLSEWFWKLMRAIELGSYGGLRPCLCTPCEWPDDGSFSYNTPVSHTNCVLYRKQQHTNNITEQPRDSGNHQSPPPSPTVTHRHRHRHMLSDHALWPKTYNDLKITYVFQGPGDQVLYNLQRLGKNRKE
jgi:hypothetical protein